MASIPTIRVIRKSDKAECSINECDYDAKIHTKAGAKPKKEKAPEGKKDDAPKPDKKADKAPSKE